MAGDMAEGPAQTAARRPLPVFNSVFKFFSGGPLAAAGQKPS